MTGVKLRGRGPVFAPSSWGDCTRVDAGSKAGSGRRGSCGFSRRRRVPAAFAAQGLDDVPDEEELDERDDNDQGDGRVGEGVVARGQVCEAPRCSLQPLPQASGRSLTGYQ